MHDPSAGGVFKLIWVLIALPLAGAVILLLGGRRTNRWGHLLGCLTALASFALGVAMFVQMLNRPASEREIGQDRKSTRLNSSHVKISYAVFCLKKKKKKKNNFSIKKKKKKKKKKKETNHTK